MGRYDDYEDDRMVIVERDSGGSGLGALLLGMVIGAGAALLLAPESGEAMRARIRRETKRATSKAKEYVDDVSEELSETMGRTRKTVGRKVEQARDVVEDRARAVGDAVEAGRVAARQAKAELGRAVNETKKAYEEARLTKRIIDDVEQSDGGDTDGEENVSPA